jgi:hypothetical protein
MSFPVTSRPYIALRNSQGWLCNVALVFGRLQMIAGPAIFSAVEFVLNMPFFKKYQGPPDYHRCLTKFYNKVNVEKVRCAQAREPSHHSQAGGDTV